MNVFAEKATKYLPILDEIYQKESLTSMLEMSGVKFDGTKTIKKPKLSLDGAGDYDRDTGYADGALNISYESHELEFDRGRKFRIDVIDNDEVAFDLYRKAVTEYVRTKEIPETDAIRFSRMVTNAGTIKDEDITAATALSAYDDAEEYLKNSEVSGDLVLYASTQYAKLLKQSPDIAKRIDANINNGTIDRRVKLIDGSTPIIEVPKKRFYDVIELLDGKTAGQTAGGYKPVVATSKEINFILLPKTVAEAITKRNNVKIIIPEVNQSADAYDVMYRSFHDLIVDDNKKAGIYVSRKTTAITA